MELKKVRAEPLQVPSSQHHSLYHILDVLMNGYYKHLFEHRRHRVERAYIWMRQEFYEHSLLLDHALLKAHDDEVTSLKQFLAKQKNCRGSIIIAPIDAMEKQYITAIRNALKELAEISNYLNCNRISLELFFEKLSCANKTIHGDVFNELVSCLYGMELDLSKLEKRYPKTVRKMVTAISGTLAVLHTYHDPFCSGNGLAQKRIEANFKRVLRLLRIIWTINELEVVRLAAQNMYVAREFESLDLNEIIIRLSVVHQIISKVKVDDHDDKIVECVENFADCHGLSTTVNASFLLKIIEQLKGSIQNLRQLV